MTTKKKLPNFTPADFQMIRDAIQYNLEHLKVDLRLQRMGFFRHNADRICAMINGYITLGKKADGDHEEYKASCYASQSAYNQLSANGWKTAKGILVFEHVIPIDFAGEYILGIWNRREKKNFSPPISDRRLLKLLNALIIPCVITKLEDDAIPKPFKSSMPPGWKRNRHRNWERYNQTLLSSGTLFNQIVVLQAGITSLPKTKVPNISANFYAPVYLWPLHMGARLNILL